MFFEKVTKKEATTALSIIGLYLLWTIFVVGFRNDHLYFILIILGAYFVHPTSRKILLALLFFISYWVVYDALRLYPNYLFNEVSIQEIYDLEKAWFGIEEAGKLLTPNEWFSTRLNPTLDVLTGFFYLTWIPIPLGFAFWLYFRDKKLMVQFIFVFFLLNMFGLMVYYLYPAAPPWYVELHGFEKNFEIPGSPARLVNFDNFFGIGIFDALYSKNANVFAAVPSIHSAIPVSTFYFAWKKRLKGATITFFIVMVSIWFSAVYSNHHYIIDVGLGALCATTAIVLFEIMMKTKRVQQFFDRYAALIS